MNGVIFDLDQTLINTSFAELHRKNGQWKEVIKLIPSFQPYDGVFELIDLLRSQETVLALVTNSPKAYAIEVIKHFEIRIDYVIGYHDTLFKKPHPDAFIKVLKYFNLNSQNTYSLGDRAIDIEASNKAKVKSCACYWGSFEKERLANSKADYQFYQVIDAINFFSFKS